MKVSESRDLFLSIAPRARAGTLLLVAGDLAEGDCLNEVFENLENCVRDVRLDAGFYVPLVRTLVAHPTELIPPARNVLRQRASIE